MSILLDSLFSRCKSILRPPSFRCIVTALAVFLFLCVGQAPAASDEGAAVSQLKAFVIKGYEDIEVDLAARRAELKKATIAIGSREITADQFIIFWKDSVAGMPQNAEDIEKSIVSGNIKIVSEYGVVTAQELVYNAAEQTLVITGEPATWEYKEVIVSTPKYRFTNFAL